MNDKLCTDMLKLFDAENTSVAILFFENGKQVKVYAKGKRGVFFGFLTIVEGMFSVSELQEYGNGWQIFTTNQSNVQIGNIRADRHIVVMAPSFATADNSINDQQDITLVYGFTPDMISYQINNDDIFSKTNNVRCALFFPDNIDNIKSTEIKKIEQSFAEMPDKIYYMNYLKEYKSFKPFFLQSVASKYYDSFKKFPIYREKKTVAVFDFGTSKSLIEVLRKYFQILIVPYYETFRDIKYLYKDKKIDGVIIPDFVCNIDFINDEQNVEIKHLLDSKIPVLGIGNGAILLAKQLGATIEDADRTYTIDDYIVVDLNKKQFHTTNFCYQQIIKLPLQLRAEYYDEYANFVGFTCLEKNNIAYTFSFFSDSLDTAYFLNKFYRVIKKCKH